MSASTETPPVFPAGQRTDDSYARHDETTFDFLSRVDDVVFDRIRVLMNERFDDIPADKAARLREDFLSGRDALRGCVP
jgi:hypothetical protein